MDPLLDGAQYVERCLSASANSTSNNIRPLFNPDLPVTPADVAKAALRVGKFAHRTPLMSSSSIDRIANDRHGVSDSRRAGSEMDGEKRLTIKLFFKCENFQRVGAFKFRGAVNAISQIVDSDHVVTHSSGNHAQAVALAARLMGKKSTIVMPKDAPEVKRKAVEDFGGIVVPVEAKDRDDVCDKISRETGAVLVHPFNDTRVIAGQGTVALEIWSQMRGRLDKSIKDTELLHVIVVPVGGGGCLSGVAVAAQILFPNALICAAEPEIADDAYRSMISGKIEDHRNGVIPLTVGDGLRTTLGPKTFAIIKHRVAKVILVSEREILDTTRLVMERLKIVIEPSAAVSLAAVLSKNFDSVYDLCRERHHDGVNREIRVSCVFTGGNMDLKSFVAML